MSAADLRGGVDWVGMGWSERRVGERRLDGKRAADVAQKVAGWREKERRLDLRIGTCGRRRVKSEEQSLGSCDETFVENCRLTSTWA